MTTTMQSPAQAIVPMEPAANGVPDFRPRTFEQALKFCELIAKSELVPQAFRNKPGDVFSAIQFGAEIGLGPMKALQSIAVVNGRPTLWGDNMLGLVQGSGKLEWIKEEQTDLKATCTVKRVGYEAYTVTFTMEDARKAGLSEKPGPWKQFPKRMLQMRARSYALRDRFADVLGGLEVAEVMHDVKPVFGHGPTEPMAPTVSAEQTVAELDDLQAKLDAQRAAQEAPIEVDAEETTIDDSLWTDFNAVWQETHKPQFEACKKTFGVKHIKELPKAERVGFRNTMADLVDAARK